MGDEAEEQERRELRKRVALINAAGSGALPLDEAIAVLRNDEAPAAVRRAVLTRVDIPAEVISEALWMPDASVRAAAVSLPSTPEKELEWASRDLAWQVRAEVAAHPAVPAGVLAQMLRDTSSVVRRAAIARPEVPIDALVDIVVAGGSRLDAEIIVGMDRFVIDEHVDRLLEADDTGAKAVLTRQEVPTALLRRYARGDHSTGVRAAALRRGVPQDVADETLATARENEVRQAAVVGGTCSPAALALAAADVSVRVRTAVAGCLDTPTAALDVLLTDAHERVRRAAAANPQASAAALGTCIDRDPEAEVRMAAVRNPSCPPDAIVAGCRDVDVVVFAAANPSCPPEGLFAALITLRDVPADLPPGTQGDGPATKRSKEIARTRKEALRRLAPRSWSFLQTQDLPALSPSDLMSLLTRHLGEAALDERPGVRRAVAAHRDVDDATLLLLAQDPDEQVRQAVTVRILGAATGGLTPS